MAVLEACAHTTWGEVSASVWEVVHACFLYYICMADKYLHYDTLSIGTVIKVIINIAIYYTYMQDSTGTEPQPPPTSPIVILSSIFLFFEYQTAFWLLFLMLLIPYIWYLCDYRVGCMNFWWILRKMILFRLGLGSGLIIISTFWGLLGSTILMLGLSILFGSLWSHSCCFSDQILAVIYSNTSILPYNIHSAYFIYA